MDNNQRFSRYAWGVLILNLLVVLGGGFVSASGSGDGCGASWPLCGDIAVTQVTPAERLVEMSHRLTSGLALIAVIVMLVWARRRFEPRHLARRAAWVALAGMISESLVGAGLVLFELVDTNMSLARAVVQPIHLANTFLLLAAIGLTAWWSSRGGRLQRGHPLAWPLAIALGGIVILGGFGTVASLASTIFPSESFLEGVQRDFMRDEHFLIRLRVWHPIVATVVGGYLVLLRRWVMQRAPSPAAETFSYALLVLFALQYALGALTAVTLAPVPLSLLHLLLSDLVWLSAIFLSAAVLTTEAAPVAARLVSAD